MPPRQEFAAFKRESDNLKHLVAELSFDLHRLKKTSVPHLHELPVSFSLDAYSTKRYLRDSGFFVISVPFLRGGCQHYP